MFRSPGSIGGFYNSWDRITEDYRKSDAFKSVEIQRHNASRSTKFFNKVRQRFQIPTGTSGVIDDVLSFELQATNLNSGASFTDAIKIVNIWVDPNHRQRGHAKDFIGTLVEIAEETSVPILAISNPFEFPAGWTANEVRQNLKKDEYHSKLTYVRRGTRKLQEITNKIFSYYKFQNVNYRETFEKPNRCRVQDTWIYLPTKYSSYLDWGDGGITSRLRNQPKQERTQEDQD